MRLRTRQTTPCEESSGRSSHLSAGDSDRWFLTKNSVAARPPRIPSRLSALAELVSAAGFTLSSVASSVLGDPLNLFAEEPLAIFGLQVLVMVCVCCRCCVCCKCGRGGGSSGSGDDSYRIAEGTSVPVRGKRRLKKRRSFSHEVASSSRKSVQSDRPVQSVRPVSELSYWHVPSNVDVVPLSTKPVVVSSDENLPFIDADGENADCCRQKRKPGFRPLRGSSVPISGATAEPPAVASSSTRQQRRTRKMDKSKSSGGGFFQRWFGGAPPERERTVSPPRAVSPYRDENDYATIDRIRFGKREFFVAQLLAKQFSPTYRPSVMWA
ncbi:hypothetical protein Q1695_012271 [Nippostrongylus brasiliensis]|nr:hypothetical protein Q1695_012271 [Nippostrongylus brasiliensis]